jgi:hypothetical protein
MKVRFILAAALVTLAVLPAAGQSVKVSFHGGKVDLAAENATVRAILIEWARVGGTRVVNAERLAGPPITIQFKDAYEQQVLESLLRGVAGYIVGQRVATTAAPAVSGFDRIVILPTSNAPRPSAITPAASRPVPQPMRRLPVPIEENLDDLSDESDGNAAQTPRPETAADLRRRLGQLLEADDDDPVEEPAAPAPSPNNPFGIVPGAARPGVIAPVPSSRPAQPRPDQNGPTQP